MRRIAIAFAFIVTLVMRAGAQQPDHKDVVYATVDGFDLLLDIYYPKNLPPKAPEVVVWIHGGGWRAGSKAPTRATLLTNAGFAVVSINYRLTGRAIFPAQIHDCKAAIRWVRAHAAQYGFDAMRIGVWGSSAGGHLVALLGTSNGVQEMEGTVGEDLGYSSDVQAVCDWYGPSNFLTMGDYPSSIDRSSDTCPEALLIGGAIPDNPDKAWTASPMKYIDGNEPPFLIHHGTDDMTVPFHQSVELDSALQLAGIDVTFTPIEGAGHGGPEFTERTITDEVVAFFQRALRGGTTGIERTPEDFNVLDIFIYPNPATDNATLRIESPEVDRLTVSIVDILGNGIPVAAFDIDRDKSVLLDLPIQSLKPGTYTVRVSGHQGVMEKRLVVK